MDRSDTEGRIKKLRKEYCSGNGLDESTVASDPFTQFGAWFDVAIQAGLLEPNAMALATVGERAKPSVRMVLLKQFSSKEGFCFFSNYLSRKGQELEMNSHASLLFFWGELERQIRIEGVVERVTRSESEAYFASRPRGSQLGAAASTQSKRLDGRAELESAHAELVYQCEGRDVPCPENWGGYRLIPDYFEFWQGRENRLHDRVFYSLTGQDWTIGRLSP